MCVNVDYQQLLRGKLSKSWYAVIKWVTTQISTLLKQQLDGKYIITCVLKAVSVVSHDY